MPIEKIDDYADGSGAVVQEPTPTEKALGWKEGEQVTAGHNNWWSVEITGRINKIIDERINSFYSDAVDPNKMISAGLWDESWASPEDAVNRIDAGSTARSYRDVRPYFDADGNPRVLILDNDNCTVEVWDARTRTHIVTTLALSLDLPSGSSETWEPYSMCTDGVNLYVMAADTNAVIDTHIVQAWVISESSADWAVKSGWNATGTALTGNGNGAGTYQKDGKIIMADSGYLALSCGWNPISATTSAAIIIVDISDGTFSAGTSGAGDAPIAVAGHASASICSDGTNVYFGVYRGGPHHYVCSARIANPQLGASGAAGYPFYQANATSHQIVSCGNLIVSTFRYPSPTATSEILRTHSAVDADLDMIVTGVTSQASGIVGDKYLHFYATDLEFDGINVWLCGTTDLNAAERTLVKVDTAKLFAYKPTSATRQLSDIASGPYLITPSQIGPVSSAVDKYAQACFDGRDIWVNLDPRTGQTYSGDLMRLSLVLLRS